MRCWARQGRSLKERGIDPFAAAEAEAETGAETGTGAGARAGAGAGAGVDRGGIEPLAAGVGRVCRKGRGSSTNMMDGPGPSSVATRVTGTWEEEKRAPELRRER